MVISATGAGVSPSRLGHREQALSRTPPVVRFHGSGDAVPLKLSLDGHFSKVPESGALDSIDTPEYGITFSLI